MMYSTYVVLLCLWMFHSSTASNYCHGSNSARELFLGKYEIPVRKTDSPINVDTKNVIRGNYPPLLLKPNSNDTIILKNTGRSFWAIESNPKSESVATQGVFGNCTYQFSGIRFLWTNEKNGICGQTIDGKGHPMQAIVYFFKRIYRSFRQALNYRDGLAALVFPISISSTPNKDFESFAKEMRKIQKAGTSTPTTLGNTIKWYGNPANDSLCYSYPGGYELDDCTRKTYYCEIVTVVANNTGSLSKEQFDQTFGQLKNYKNCTYTDTKETYPTKVKIIESKGVILKKT